MFVRAKKSGAYQYLQLVRSERVDGHVRQQVIATLGRLDVLQNAGKIDALISKQTIQELQKAHRRTRFILGARLRAVKEIREQVLGDAGPYEEVHGPRVHSKDPSPLKIKEVRIADRRYIVCCNEEQGPCGAAVDPHRARTIHVR